MSGRARRASPAGGRPGWTPPKGGAKAVAPTGAGRSGGGSRRSSRSRAGPRPARSPRAGPGSAAATDAWPCAQCCTSARKSLLIGRDELFVPLQELHPVLELGDSELELLVLRAQDEPELAQDSVQSLAGPLRRACRIAAPARHNVVDRRPRVFAAHAPTLRERLDELLYALRRQRDRAERGQEHLLERVPVVISLGHAASTCAAAGAAPVWRPYRSRRARPPRGRARGPARQRRPVPRPRTQPRRPPTPCRRPSVARTPAPAPSTSSGAAPRWRCT